MKVTGAPPLPISPQGIAPGSKGAGPDGASTTVQSIHLDAARHGVDEAQLLHEMRSSHVLSHMAESRQSSAAELRNTMIRAFGPDVVEHLFKQDVPKRHIP